MPFTESGIDLELNLLDLLVAHGCHLLVVAVELAGLAGRAAGHLCAELVRLSQQGCFALRDLVALGIDASLCRVLPRASLRDGSVELVLHLDVALLGAADLNLEIGVVASSCGGLHLKFLRLLVELRLYLEDLCVSLAELLKRLLQLVLLVLELLLGLLRLQVADAHDDLLRHHCAR